MSFTQHQLRVDGSTWLDVNPLFSNSLQPERYADVNSILYCSFYNLLNCPIGSRGRIFQPQYGSSLLWFLQQPIDDTTAQQIRLSIMQTFERWEPRFELNYAETYVVPDYNLPGYKVKLSGYYNIGKEYASVTFNLEQ